MLFISSMSQATLHGVYAIEVQPPAQIQATGTGRAAIVGQFPWGPDAELYPAPSIAEVKKVFAPPGTDRLSKGYLAMIAKAWPELVLVRVLGSAAAKARLKLKEASTNVLEVTAKYKGVAGNSITIDIEDATDGDADHFNLIATVTGASGTTTDKIENLNISGTGDDAFPTTDPELAKLQLLGGFSKMAAGRPDNGTFTLGTTTKAVITGTVALTSGALFGNGGTLDGQIFTVTSDLGAVSTTFNDPADAAAVASQINTQAAGKLIASINGSTQLVITSTTGGLIGTLLIGAGNANSTLGFTGAATATGDGTAGADGTINAAAYTGTAGTGDKGLALLENDKAIRHVTVDDCGSGIRAAVNAGVKSHVESMGDRMAHIHGDVGQTAADARTDALDFASKYVRYYDPWAYIFDDVTGSKQLVPPAPFGASVAAQLSPSTAISAKASEVTTGMLKGIVGLETQRGLGAGTNTTAGVVTLIKEENGGYAFEADVTTIAPSNPAIKRGTRTQMGIYIAAALQASLRALVDSPNVRATWNLLLPPTHAFLDSLKRNADRDPFHLACIKDFAIGRIEEANTPAEIQAGDLKVPIQVTTIAPIERLLFLMQFGETVTVTLKQ